jgi:hypothetical protein
VQIRACDKSDRSRKKFSQNFHVRRPARIVFQGNPKVAVPLRVQISPVARGFLALAQKSRLRSRKNSWNYGRLARNLLCSTMAGASNCEDQKGSEKRKAR